MKRLLVLLFVCVLAVPGLAQEPDPANTLQVAHFFKSGGLDPMLTDNLSQMVYYDPLYDALVWLDGEGQVQPRLATDWEITPEHVTFTLREGVSFSDGAPFNAQAVIANYDYAATEGNGISRPVWNNVTEVEALDDFTVRYHLAEEDPFFMEFLSTYAGMMVSPNAFGDAETNPIGVGPFVLNLAETIEGSLFVYDRNPDYWDAENVALERIVIRNLGAADVPNAYLAGDADVAFTAAGLTRLLAGTDANLLIADDTIYGMMVWDRDGSVVPALGEQAFRCALSQAVNSEGYTQALGGLIFDELLTVPPPGTYGASGVEKPAYDVDAATEAIRAGGYEGVTLPSGVSSNQQNRHEAITGQFSALGVNVTTELAAGDFYPRIFSGDFPLSVITIENIHFSRIVADYLLADSPLNPFGAVDEDIEALYAETQGLSLEEAEPLYEEISRLFNERCYFFPASLGGIGIALAPHVEGLQDRAGTTGFVSLRDLRLNR